MTPAVPEPQQFKRASLAQWEKAAPGWNAHSPQIRAWLRRATDAMLGMAGVGPGARVLDVAAGAGDQTLDIAARVGSSGFVLATDLSPVILGHAKANAERAGHANVQTLVADGEALEVEAASFDAAVCRLGLMLFAQPLLALRQMHRALKPGGGICTMVFAGPEGNPCATTLLRTALQHAGLPPRDPYAPGGLFSLGKPGLVDALFEDAGFREVATTRLSAPLPPAQQAAAWSDMEARLAAFQGADGWEGPNELLLTAAKR